MNQRRAAIAMVVASVAVIQVAASFAKSLFEATGPLTMTWLRLVTAGVLLALVARPRLRGHSSRDWLTLLGYTAALVGMNVSIYQAMARMPLGVAVTIEFLGPLAVAVATGRGWRDYAWAGLAFAGVALFGWAPGSLTWAGAGFALVAAAGWASYILIGPAVGRRWAGVEAVAYANLAGAVALAVPVLIWHGPVLSHLWVWAAGFGVGLLNSVIPYSLELQALRRLEKRIFSILMSLEPALAALAALAVLGERLTGVDLVAMACVVAASAGVTWRARPAAGEASARTPI
ncbi:MAG: EamA family transporter [Propionibacteriaceae bacterium]|nr:EamA family transporter [Propionibacteriaceae bacterium]